MWYIHLNSVLFEERERKKMLLLVPFAYGMFCCFVHMYHHRTVHTWQYLVEDSCVTCVETCSGACCDHCNKACLMWTRTLTDWNSHWSPISNLPENHLFWQFLASIQVKICNFHEWNPFAFHSLASNSSWMNFILLFCFSLKSYSEVKWKYLIAKLSLWVSVNVDIV